VDAAGKLWLGDDQGLFRWENGKVTERLSVNEGLPGPSVTAVAEAHDGLRWVAASGTDARRGGVLHLGKDDPHRYTPANSPLPSSRPRIAARPQQRAGTTPTVRSTRVRPYPGGMS
jgi:hypothetical protein